jgi:hypothetical protein
LGFRSEIARYSRCRLGMNASLKGHANYMTLTMRYFNR